MLESPADVVGDAFFDEMRLKGSTIKNSEDLLAKLRTAVYVVGGDEAYQYLTPSTPMPGPNGGAGATAGATPTTTGTAATRDSARADAQARAVLRDVRLAVNGFRDDKWEGLARSRNRLIATGLCTGLTAYAVLALAILVGAPASAIVAAAAFYLVGAMVGLFNQLRRDAKDQTASEDFGFSRVRLTYTPVLSGIAGVGGVVAAAMLYAVVDGSGLLYLDQGPSTSQEVPLRAIFDLTRNGFGLLVAAVFGLTPDLLVDRLQQRADAFRSDLKSTSAVETEGGPDK